MAVLKELTINIYSNYGDTYIVFDEIVFKNAAGDTLPNTGIVLTASSNLSSSGWELQKLLNGLYTSSGNVQGWASAPNPAYPQWLKFVFPSGFDCASISLVNRSDVSGSKTSPKDVSLTAFLDNQALVQSQSRPSDDAGYTTVHTLAEFNLVTYRANVAPPLRLAPGANTGALVPRINQAQIIRIDRRDGGVYRLSGTVTVSGTPASRRVKLFEQRANYLMRETWSDASTGQYRFDNIRPGTYFVIAFDHTGAFDPEAKADLQSEPMP